MPIKSATTSSPHQTEINTILKKLLNRFFLLFIAAGTISIAGIVIRITETGWAPVYAVHSLSYFGLIAAFFIFKRRSPQSIALALFSIIALDAVANLLTYGLTGIGILMLGYMAVMIGIFLSMGAGLIALGLDISILILLSTGISAGWLPTDYAPTMQVTSWTTWLALISTFIVMTTTAIALASAIKKYLLHSLQILQTKTRDLTQTNRELLESQHTVTAIIDTAPEAIITASLEGTIMSCNEQARQLFNFSTSDKLVGTDLYSRIPEEYSQKIRTLFGSMISRCVSCRDIEFIIIANPDKNIPVKMSAALVFDQEKKPSGFLIILQDITAAKEIEAHLRQSEKMEAIGQLAGGIAHDFNNQLTGILGFAELLRQNLAADPSNLEEVDAIIQTAKKASELTQQLLTFSRKEMKTSEPFDLHQIIRDVQLLLNRTLNQSITVNCNTDAKNSIVHGDAAQMQSVLLNLALNSRDAMPEGGTITISTWNRTASEIINFFPLSRGSVQKPYIILTVKDTGTGIAEETLERIFEPFFTTKDPGKGTGMGLANVYSTIKNHGGTIEVRSKAGMGTEMKIFLPEFREEK